jgi:hypothetical protein
MEQPHPVLSLPKKKSTFIHNAEDYIPYINNEVHGIVSFYSIDFEIVIHKSSTITNYSFYDCPYITIISHESQSCIEAIRIMFSTPPLVSFTTNNMDMKCCTCPYFNYTTSIAEIPYYFSHTATIGFYKALFTKPLLYNNVQKVDIIQSLINTVELFINWPFLTSLTIIQCKSDNDTLQCPTFPLFLRRIFIFNDDNIHCLLQTLPLSIQTIVITSNVLYKEEREENNKTIISTFFHSTIVQQYYRHFLSNKSNYNLIIQYILYLKKYYCISMQNNNITNNIYHTYFRDLQNNIRKVFLFHTYNKQNRQFDTCIIHHIQQYIIGPDLQLQ